MTDKDKQKVNVVNTVDMNNRQIIIDKFLNLQSKLIKKQHQTGRKIHGKRAFINFLLPNLNNKKAIDKNNSSYWQNLYQEVQSKPVEEYTVDDIVFENTDYLLEYQIVNQSLKTKLRITIKSCFNINNQTLYSNLILDIWGLNDIKAIQNQINILNNKQNTQEIFEKHNIQVIENTITDEQQNIVFQLKQNPIINVDDNDDLKYDSIIQFNIIQDTQFLNKFDITKILSRVELDILSKLDKNSNQSVIYSTYKDFFQKFNVEDFFVLNQTDNLIDIHVTYLDLFWYQKRIRYDVQKNWIDYAGLSDSDRTKNNESILHHMFDSNYYQTHSDFQDNYNDFKNKLDKLSQTALPLKDLFVLISEYVSVNIYAPLKYSFHIESKMMENGGLYGYRSVLNNMKNNSYLNYLLLSSLSKKHKQGINRCKLFYYYVLFFNPEFKNLWNSRLLQINTDAVSEEYFYSIFNLFSLVSQKYPNLMKNLDKYLRENKGLFPIIIYHPISEINNDPNNLLSYKKNQSLFDSKNQFHLLNRKKSSLLTKLYLFCLSKYNNDLSENCVFNNDVSAIVDTYHPNYEIDGNINRIYTQCLKTTYQHEQERKHNLLLNLFWKMVADNQVSNRQLYFALSLCVKLFIFNFNKIEQMFGYQTTKLMLDIVSLHFYKQILLIIQNKTDWRSSFHVICNSNHLCSSLNRDAFIFYDFLIDIYSRYQDNEKLQSIVDKSNYQVDLDFINHYEESVQKCLTADVENNAFIINLINDRLRSKGNEGQEEMLIFAFDKKLKLFPNSTFESIQEYINNINQFYLRQEQIANHQVKYYTYSSYSYQEHQFKLETINMEDVCFEPILNSGRLIAEGVNMKHCVASYDYSIMNDKFLVYHITDKTSYPSESLEKTYVLSDLTLGLSLNKNLFNLVISANPNLNNINHSDSFVKFNQCYGYKNAIISNPDQNKNIELLVKKLIEQLNQQLVNIIKAHQQANLKHNK
jgi:hypothetical protein